MVNFVMRDLARFPGPRRVQELVEEKIFHCSSAKLMDLRPYSWGPGIRERCLPMENGCWPTQHTRRRKCSCTRRGPGKRARSRMTKLTITVLHGYQMASMSSLLDPSRDILDDCIGWTWRMDQPAPFLRRDWDSSDWASCRRMASSHSRFVLILSPASFGSTAATRVQFRA